MDLVPKKKGRPKKVVQDPPESVEGEDVKKDHVSPKKRGRKKKEQVTEDPVVKQKKKRGRKAAIKYFSSSIRKKIPLTAVIQDNNQYILHLDVPNTPSDDNNVVLQTEPQNMGTPTEQCEAPLPIELTDHTDSHTDSTEGEADLKDLYEKRLKNRDVQDQMLIQKLEKLAISNEPNEIDPLLQSLLKSKSTSPNDCCETDATDKEIVQKNRKKGYFELMYEFVHNEEWIGDTNICCWWCCHGFEGVPLGLPLKFIKQINKFRVRGVFCSFPCMLSFNLCSSDPSSRTTHDLINYLHFKLTGQHLTCRRAPPKWTLKMFGGELSIEEFRQSNESGTAKLYKMIYYPMFMSKDYVEEVDIANIKNANQNVFVTNSNSFTTHKQNMHSHDKIIQDAKTRLSKMENTVVTPTNTIDKFIKFS